MAQADPAKSFADEILREDLQSYLRQQEQDPGDHLAPYQAALIYSRLGEYGEALRSYQLAIERFPDFQQAYYNMGAAYSALRRLGEAEQAYRKAISLDGEDSEAWANLGAVQEALGHLDAALESYAKSVALESGEQEAQLRMARIHLTRGEYEPAHRICEAVLERVPQSPEAWNDLGLVHFHQGQRSAAEGCYHKAIEFKPDYAQAWCNLGNVRAASGDDREAERAYRTALEHNDRDADLWFNLGEFYFQRGHRETERCLWQAVERNREDLEAWELLRRWYAGHANPQRLKTVLRVLALARPEDATLLLELARAAELEQDFSQALDAYRKLIGREPDNEAAQLGLVRVHLKEGQVLEAFRHLHTVRATSPEVIDQWIHVGHRLRHRERREEAEVCFTRALEHRPDEPELAQYLGEIAQERKAWQQAFQWFERAGEINRNDRHVWIPLMRAFFAQDDFVRAAACLEHLDELAQHLPGLWVEYDEVYAKAGRRQELLERIESWLELGLVHGSHWEQLAQLYEGAGLPERAAACRARARQAAPLAPAAKEHAYLEPRASSPILQTEPDATGPPAPAAADESDPEYWIGQGEAHLEQGRVEEAVQSLNRALALDIPRFRAWFRIGGLFYLLRQLDEAEGAFRRATELQPEEAKGWYNLGVCQAEQGRVDSAVGNLRRAIRLDRRMGRAWDWLGLLHFDAGEHPQARRCFVRCLAVSRDSANAWHNLGMLYRAMGREDESRRCLDQARQLGGVDEQSGIFRGRPGLSGHPGTRRG